MNTKNISIGVLAAVALVLGVLVVKQPTVIGVPTSIKLDASTLGSQKAPNVTVEAAKPVYIPAPVVNVTVPKQEQVLGAMPGSELFTQDFTVNGVRTYYYSQGAAQTGSTTCQFKLPNATTTLAAASAYFSRLASTTQVEIGNSSTVMATTTKIGLEIIPTTGDQVVASSTSSSFVMKPNTYVAVKIGGGSTAGTVTPIGRCKLVVREL